MDEVDERNMSFEPMDVDLSGNSASINDHSYSNSDSSPRRNDEYRQRQGWETPNSDRKAGNSFDVDKPIKMEKSGYQQKQGHLTLNPNLTVKNLVYNFDLDKAIKLEKEKSSGTIIKKYHIKKRINKQKKENLEKQKVKKSTSLFKILGLSLFFLGMAFILHSFKNLKCSVELDLVSLKHNLTENLFGQKFAVDDIVEALSLEVQSKILFLYGGTGVGKTFAVSLILNSLLPSSNIYHYTMPSFVNTFPNEFMFGLAMCKNSMIIVDDLTNKDDAIIKTHIIDVLQKSENLAKNLTIILIYNCDIIQKDFTKKCDLSFKENLQSSFNDMKAMKKFIKFNPLSEEHLRKCIEREINDVMEENDMIRIIANFNVSLDGCKGVFHKIKLLNNV